MITALISLTSLTVEAGLPQTHVTGPGTTIVNNYYMDDFGYHYSSRINRFHRSYSAFEYYSPVFTETYWYNYEPYTWGLTIYSGGGFGYRYGYSWSYPAYYSSGWSAPGFYGAYSWGYDPFYYDWYTPVIINVRIRNYYPNYRTRYIARYDYGYNNIRVVNNYNSFYYGNNVNTSRFNYASSPYPSSSSANISRRNSSTTVSNSGMPSSRRTTAGEVTQRSTVVTGAGTASGTNQVNSDTRNSDTRRVSSGNQVNTDSRTNTGNRAIVNPNRNTGNAATVTNSGRGTITRPGTTGSVTRQATTGSSNRQTTQQVTNTGRNTTTTTGKASGNVRTETKTDERKAATTAVKKTDTGSATSTTVTRRVKK
ncbi:MAG: hypothetical protein IH591_19675 [Bacteroidales bacterium]|nr:hypothetical protein [Bacteroidales bacterium]